MPSLWEALAQQSGLYHVTSCFLLIVELLLFLVCTSLTPQNYYTIATAASVVECCCWRLFSSGSMRRLQKNEIDQVHGIAVCKLQVTAAHTKTYLSYLGVSELKLGDLNHRTWFHWIAFVYHVQTMYRWNYEWYEYYGLLLIWRRVVLIQIYQTAWRHMCDDCNHQRHCKR